MQRLRSCFMKDCFQHGSTCILPLLGYSGARCWEIIALLVIGIIVVCTEACLIFDGFAELATIRLTFFQLSCT